jgi:hypothetical protein
VTGGRDANEVYILLIVIINNIALYNNMSTRQDPTGLSSSTLPLVAVGSVTEGNTTPVTLPLVSSALPLVGGALPLVADGSTYCGFSTDTH